MTVWKVQGFGGMVPALDPRLLPDTAAMYAQNCLLKPGSIGPLPEPEALHTLGVGASFAYRLPASYADASFLYGSTYMEFNDPDMMVIRAPVVDDQYDRYYFVSPQEPPKYNTRARIDASQPAWLLGVPAPSVAPIVNSSGGVSSTLETRSYVYTWVTDYGEEGPPSPSTERTDKIDASPWVITCALPTADDMGVDRNLTKLRIYRTVTTAEGSAAFYLVTELTLPTVIFNDTLSSAVVSLNPQLESTQWAGPPSDLSGWILAPNGFIVGWRGTQFAEIWFSEPYRPHAWPAEYTLVVEYPIVGMGISNQTIVCCTEAYPVSLQGVHPHYMEVNKLVNHEPCMARGSILSGPEGVFYASPNGLVLVTPGLAENITKGIIGKRDWNGLVKVPRLRAARLGTAYFAYGSVQIGVFQDDAFQIDAFATEDVTGALTGVVIDPTSDRVSFSMLRQDTPVDNCYNDPWSGEVILISDGEVQWLDIVTENVTYQSYLWKSKIWQNSYERNAAACKVYWDTAVGLSENPVAMNPNPNEIRFYVKGGNYLQDTLILTRPLEVPGELIRLPSGGKYDYIRFEIESTYRILSVQFATTVKELDAA